MLFVEEICEILSELFPNLWKLGQSYFSGELHVKVEPGRQLGFKVPTAVFVSYRLMHCHYLLQHMVLTIIETFCKTFRSAIVSHTLDKNADKALLNSWPSVDMDTLAPWLPACLRYIRSTYKILIKLDLPSEVLDIVASLILDLRIYSMSILFKQTTEQVKQLHATENWIIDFKNAHSGITELVRIVKASKT